MKLHHVVNHCKERGFIPRDTIREIILALPETLGHMHDTKRDTFLIRVEQLEDAHDDYKQWKAPT